VYLLEKNLFGRNCRVVNYKAVRGREGAGPEAQAAEKMNFQKIKDWLEIGKATAAGRNLHVDALKGITIIFVVWAHTIQINHPLKMDSYYYLTLSSFAMPLFMLLSGYIINTQMKNTLPGFVKKYALRLIVPFFVWSVIVYLMHRYYSHISLPVYLLTLAKFPANGLWFLWALFLNSTVLFAVLRLVRRKKWERWENYLVIASIVLSRVASTEYFGLSDFKVYYTYYAAGFFVCKYYDWVKARRKIFYAVSIVAFPPLLMAFQSDKFPSFYPVLQEFFGDTGIARLTVSIYKYAIAFAGMGVVSFLLELARRTRVYAFCAWTGLFTLDIYVIHGVFAWRCAPVLWQYAAVAVLTFVCSLALTIMVLRRFRPTRLIFLGQNR